MNDIGDKSQVPIGNFARQRTCDGCPGYIQQRIEHGTFSEQKCLWMEQIHGGCQTDYRAFHFPTQRKILMIGGYDEPMTARISCI